jgi:uncharacterized protein YcgI (DUF1989 family)
MPETEIITPGGHAAAVQVSTGQFIEITDVEGGQVAEPVAFAIERHHEWLSITHTRSVTLRLNLQVGDVLLSNWRRPMYQIVHDDVGVHDVITGMCDERPIQLSKHARPQAPADGGGGH